MNLPQEPLSDALASWRIAPRREPQFRALVAARIGSARRAAGWPAFARAHAMLVAGTLALAVIIGALTGREQARTHVAADSGQLATSYVQALDARNMRMP
jgi:hypothetical protein